MMEERIRTVLRIMAWERAKAELRSILDTYFPGDIDDWQDFHDVIYNFIEKVEGEWLG
jgi:hypothetical protein